MCLLSYDFFSKLINKYKYNYYLIDIKKKDKDTQTVVNDENIEIDYDIIDNYTNNNEYLINITEL